MHKTIIHTNKLDMERLQWAARLDPDIIETEETTLEVIRACKRMGIQLFVVGQQADDYLAGFQEFFSDRSKLNPDATAGGKEATQLGTRIFFGQSDTSEFLVKSEEETHRILSNAAIKIHAYVSKEEENSSDAVHLREIGETQAPKQA